MVHHADVNHKAAVALSRLTTSEIDIKILNDEVPVMETFNQGQNQNGILKDYFDGEDSDSQRKATDKACLYVHLVLALTEDYRKHPAILQQLLEA